jgi:hypothetical protein
MSMRNAPDAVALLRELRPDPDEFEPDAAELERILATPVAAVRTPRRHGRLAVAGAVAAVAAAAVIAFVPFVGGSTDVLARAAAALNDPEAILHFKARQEGHTIEVWQTAGARQHRFIYDGALEWVEDWDARTSMAYSAERDEVIRHTEPDLFDPAHRVPRGLDSPYPGGGTNVTDDLARLLERARRGEDRIRLIGETAVRGIPVYELRIDFTIQVIEFTPGAKVDDPQSAPTRPVQVSRIVYVDRERFLPVRVVERMAGADPVVTEFLVAERLPRTPEHERLLRMAPHPGAKVVGEGSL